MPSCTAVLVRVDMKSRKLFYEDSHLRSTIAQVMEVRPTAKGWETVLDRTLFFPEGGGQPCDRGYIAGKKVLDVRERNGVIFHTLEAPLEVGASVDCELDWEYRFSLMQNHSGEHIVSGLIHSRYGYDNVGFHMGSDYITLDINGVITREELREIEREANHVIWNNLPVTTMFPEAQELGSLEYRSKLELTEDVRLVRIEGVDLCACCAPHVKRTGEIGVIRLLNLQSYKGGVRIFMLCGERALEQSFMVQDQIEALGVKFSAKQDKVLEAVERLCAEHAAVLEAKKDLTAKLLERKAMEVPQGKELLWFFNEELRGDELRLYGNLLARRNQGITAIFGADQRYLLISPEQDVRPLNQKLKEELHAKGGGSDRMVQGSIGAEREAIEEFLRKEQECCSRTEIR